ncbi:MAG: flagellar basal body P-ring protein FlgI [Myxococcota bacterium]
MRRRKLRTWGLALLVFGAVNGGSGLGTLRAEEIRQLAEVEGARENQLLGYGIVVGLNGTGDDPTAPLATQSTLALLRRLGIQVDARQLLLRNIAAVVVTANIPPFAKPGTKIDVTVSSIGNARSLEGGVLVQTLLKGADRKTYAAAQGSLVIGGFSARGNTGSKVRSGTVTSGRIPQGALVERAIPTKFLHRGTIKLALKRPSFVTASRMASAIEGAIGKGVATAVDGGTVVVRVPKAKRKAAVGFIARIQGIDVTPERRARVVISERTQTIVAGGGVTLSPVAVVHGNLTIVVRETPRVVQPEALAAGETTTVDESDVSVEEKVSSMQFLDGAATLSDLSNVLGTLGLSARELISVLQALRSAGALEAELVVQ